ncbi:MAG: inositol monophosphatase family protein [Verrucomicrobiota bacterium]
MVRWRYEKKNESAGTSPAAQVVTEVDERSEELILHTLAPSLATYDLALLTEEREDDKQRLEKGHFWCIDPLDGTLPFTRGLPGYSVSIALVSRDGSPIIGVIFDPVTQTVYRAVAGAGIEINGEPFQPTAPKHGVLRFICDGTFSTHPERESLIHEVEAVAKQEGYQGVEVIEGGGAVLNACQVLTQSPACYFKRPKPQNGGGSLWDFAATACLFEEAGLYARDFAGGLLELNRAESTFMNHRGVCYASTEAIARALRRLGSHSIE